MTTESDGSPRVHARRAPLPRLGRNLWLLAQAATQHLADDPAFFAIQTSRRLPFPVRVRAGEHLERTAPRLPGVGALGAMMAGHRERAVEVLVRANERPLRSRLAGEVAILLDRPDLLPPSASPATRARAAWSRGNLSSAVQILEDAGAGDTKQATRLRNEISLLSPGRALSAHRPRDPAHPAPRADGTPLRVLHLLTNSLPHTQSGYSLRSHRILTALNGEGVESIALTRTGYPVMIGALTARDVDVVDGIRYVRSLPSALPRTQEERLLRQVDEALAVVAEFRPDVLHTTTNYLNALVTQEVSARTGIPWVLEVRGFMEQTWIASHGTDEGQLAATHSEKARLISAREAELAGAADAVVTLSGTMADELVARGVARERITLAPNGVDDSLLEDGLDPAAARAELGLNRHPLIRGDAILIGAASALVDYEGFDTLIRALALLVNDPDTPVRMREVLHVVLVGDGTARPDLAALADELGVRDRVHFPGRVRRSEVRRWVEALDAVVIPRRDVEVSRLVTPQKPVEALALGRPVIASDLPALRETLSTATGATGATFFDAGSPEDLAAAIMRVVTGTTDGSERARIGRSIAWERTWPELVRRYRGLYEQLLSDRRGGDPDAG